ncbi:MAG: nickel/cobalt transporter [Fimbriimonadaceae bacterium]|nr:nickel/cobalt transporter [Alphaproteobacteria bacterium]
MKYILVTLLAALFFALSCQISTAQNSPFALPGGSAPQAQQQMRGAGQLDRVLGYIYQKQREFQQRLTTTLKQLKQNKNLVWVLMGISFLYGVFHAAGPGHGKIVLSSYMLASNAAARRGITMAVAAAFVQAIVAILLVGVLALTIHATGITINRTVVTFENASYLLIILFGLYLLWMKLKPLFGKKSDDLVSHDHELDHPHNHDHDHCGHAHAPDPRQLEGDLPLLKAIGLVIAMGMRPCTGAVLVLLFALAQGVVWAGVAATFAMALGTALTVSTLAMIALGSKNMVLRFGAGNRSHAEKIHWSVEFVGAALILIFGIILLMASISRGAFF